MASFVYNNAIHKINQNDLDLESDTIKIMLVGTGYTPDRDHDFIGSGAGTPGGEELTATNYTGGFGGASRLTLTGKSFTLSDADDWSVFDATDPVIWPSLGNGVNDTAAGAIIIKEITSDADSLLIVFVDFPNRLTDGNDFPLLFNSAGIARWKSV